MNAACAPPAPEPSTEANFLVIAHRGASGYRPEHTLAAYRLAIEQGADFIEADLVPTRDGHLISRHENALALVAVNDSGAIERDSGGAPKILHATTDIANRPEFADRLCVKTIDGRQLAGWFSEDFDLQEIRALRAREPLPQLRSAQYDGDDGVPTLDDIIELLQAPAHQQIGLYAETKHPTWFKLTGTRCDGQPIGIDTSAVLVDTLARRGFTDPKRLYLQSFEVANLLELHQTLLPRAGFSAPLVQLIGRPDSTPFDLRHHGANAEVYGAVLAPQFAGGATYADVVAALPALSHLSGVGPHKLATADVARVARPLGLDVHPYTVRAEAFFLDAARGGIAESAEDEVTLLHEQGATGVFIDQPDRVPAALHAR